MRFAVLALLAGCGRVGFGTGSDAGGGGIPDGAFVGCTVDTFETLDPTWNAAGNVAAVDGALRLTVAGATNAESSIERADLSSPFTGWSTAVRIVQPAALTGTHVGIGWHSTSNVSGARRPAGVYLSIYNGQVQLTRGTSMVSTLFDAQQVVWLRLTAASNSVRADTSADGLIWAFVGSVAAPTGWVTRLGVENLGGTIPSDVAVFDDYVVCPP